MESIDWNTWGPPIVVLLLGLVIGLVSALRVQGGRDARPVEARAALLARKESLVEQLREHQGDRSKMDAAAWTARHEVLLAEAAEVLRALDQDSDQALVFETAAPAGRGLTMAWVAGLVVFFGVAAGLVSRFASERADDMDAPMAGTADPFAAEAAAAEAHLAANPTDLDALNTLAHIAIERKSLQEAMSLIDRARAVAPTDPELRVHVDALRLLIGMADKAQASLEQILVEAPEMSEAMRWMSYARFAQGDLDGAVAWLDKASKVGSERDRLVARAWLLELKAAQAQLAAGGTTGASTAPAAAIPAPSAGPAQVQGSIALGAGVAALGGGQLFVLARAAATERGPPLAAVKLDTAVLPVSFGLGEAELIRGGTWPDQVWLKAKWSASGDPMSTQPGDLVTELVGPFSPGSLDLALVLQPAP